MASESHRRSRRNAGRSISPSPQPFVWVGSLNGAVNDEELFQVFSNIGKVESCKIMRDDSGASR